MIFPEGTRSKDGKVHKGHTGAALIAARSGKPIIPVGVVYGDKLKFRTKLTVRYGEPIMPQDYAEISDNPNPRQLERFFTGNTGYERLKNRYMADIKLLVEGETAAEESANE